MQGDRDVISDRAVGSVLVLLPKPSLQFLLCARKAHEPVRVQSFRPELAVERLDQAIIGGLAMAEKSPR